MVRTIYADNRHREHAGRTQRESGYRPEVDGLRAIAVCAVIANHFWDGLLPGGFLGVDMFFVISGYVITASLAKAPYNSVQDLLFGFYSRRIKRLLPALVVCVAVTCLLGGLFINPQVSEYSRSMKAGLFSLFGASNIYFWREAGDYFGGSARLNLFTHTWSLGVEEQFYVVFPALFWVTGSASQRPKGRQFLLTALGVLTILSFALYLWLNMTKSSGAYFMMPPRFWELSIGCIAAITCARGHPAGMAWARWLAFVMLAMALLAPADQQLYATPAIVIGTAVLILTLRPGHLLYRLLTLQSVLLVGLMSYSLYLWHWSVLSLSRWTLGIHWWSTPFQLGAMFGLAALSYVYVERPLRYATWSTSKLRSIGYGLFAIICAAGAILGLKNGGKGILYTGTPAQMAAKGVETLMDDKWFAGKLQWRARDCVLTSNEDVGKQINAESCILKTGPASVRRQFLVIGNSFSAAEFEMYSALSEEGLGSVIATSSWGALPLREVPGDSPWAKTNEYYWSTVVPALSQHLENGDFIIMIYDLAGYAPAVMDQDTAHQLDLLKKSLSQLARELREKGVQIIFQSQNPLMREAQCTPDMAKPQWFNSNVVGQTNCVYYSKSDSIKRIQPLYDMFEDVRSVNSNFHILNLFPIMCPQTTCQFYDSRGIFLYRDMWSHPSIEANYMARPALLSLVNEAIKLSKDMAQGTHGSKWLDE